MAFLEENATRPQDTVMYGHAGGANGCHSRMVHSLLSNDSMVTGKKESFLGVSPAVTCKVNDSGTQRQLP